MTTLECMNMVFGLFKGALDYCIYNPSNHKGAILKKKEQTLTLSRTCSLPLSFESIDTTIFEMRLLSKFSFSHILVRSRYKSLIPRTQVMTNSTGVDEYGFSSSDEADFLELTNAVDATSTSQAHKRKASSEQTSSIKKIKATERSPKVFQSALSALSRNFGFKSFRLKQQHAISRILEGESAVVVFPTGGGKSLCFQVPALAFEEEDTLLKARREGEHGITLVVSPLIALMKDQVDGLIRRGIAAATIDSSKTRDDYIKTCDQLKKGELKILYVAPERLNNEGFVQQMKYVRGGIRLLAVDEAHCISEWGHSFRPDYLKIARFADEIKAERVICLTATATPRVAQDICDSFKINYSGLFRTSTYRPNLQLLAESGMTKRDLFPKLVNFLRKNKGSTIIYVTLQKHTEELALLLNQEGFKAKAFHAGMQTSAKTKLQDEFMRTDDLIMVATIAFGMGIDKGSIRNVVHFSVPQSLESYSQEIGRSGRDGEISKCFFFVSGEDLHLRELFARGDLPSLESIRRLLNDIFDSETKKLPINGEIQRSHYSQTKEFDIRPTVMDMIYAELELTHGLLRATTSRYQKYSYLAGAQKYDAKISSDRSPAAAAIVSGSEKARTLHHIDVDSVAHLHGVERNEIISKLNEWNAQGVLELRPSQFLNVYKVIKRPPQTTSDIEILAKTIHALLKNRENRALERTEKVLKLITGRACFSKTLAAHFGDELPDGKDECGHCQWCLTHEPIKIEPPPPIPFNQLAFDHILNTVSDRDDPRLLAKLAFGISSPRITQMKLGKSPIFGSMEDHKFMVLLEAFEKVCSACQE
ncbi:hypothetical protein DSL72_005339 [Monilinia vaccinii-corymbosi]|uniref:ATP-dependent DNA helicase n=1 Tax=Monilinia vaccinii-corymbosi TaxID=61207 RepID=A0A8A3PF37_9HELO|nr:hypothetical protein DSL72_005339 [Monilinia vaccinii-corymbosi]